MLGDGKKITLMGIDNSKEATRDSLDEIERISVMSKRIIIFYEHIKREYDACLTLKDQIERSNSDYKVFLYSITFEYFEAIKIADNEKIDMIIMPWIYTDKDYELVQPFVKRNANIYI